MYVCVCVYREESLSLHSAFICLLHSQASSSQISCSFIKKKKKPYQKKKDHVLVLTGLFLIKCPSLANQHGFQLPRTKICSPKPRGLR